MSDNYSDTEDYTQSQNDVSQHETSQHDNSNTTTNNTSTTNASSNNTNTTDASSNTTNTSSNNTNTSTSVDLSNNTVVTSNTTVTNEQKLNDGVVTTHTTMETTDPSAIPQITEDLTGQAGEYYDNSTSVETKTIVDEIKLYAGQISCSDFHGKGTIEDYTQLFNAAAKIANESKQMQLDVDVDGFNEFGAAADELSALFSNFILRLQNISIIDDKAFLRSVASAMKKIAHLSDVFGRFKETILATSKIQIPKSTNDTRNLVQSVMGEVNCAMNYINYFVNPVDTSLTAAKLSSDDKKIIDTAVATIDNWNVLCEQGVTIAMSNNNDIQYIKQANDDLKNKTNSIKNATNLLKAKLASFNLTPL